MKSKFINCDFSNAGIDGVYLGRNSNAEFINTKTNNNGRNGVTLGSGSEATFYGHEAKDNKAYGVFELDESSIELLGLPKDINSTELKLLLEQVSRASNDQKATILRTSFLSDFLAHSANSTTIITNLIAFAQALHLLPK